MIILSVGMPKSGSTLFVSCQRAIIEKFLVNNGQHLFEQLIRSGIIHGVGCYVHELNEPANLRKLLNISNNIGTFIVKTHIALSNEIKELFHPKGIMATYIHRDPRDVIVVSN